MNTRILVGLDGSPRQPLVLKRAIEQARWSTGQLHLCRAVTVPQHLPSEVWAMDGATLGDTLVRTAKQELEGLASQLNDLPVQTHVDIGVPSEVICSTAEAIDADLIVIGTHGFSTLDRLIGTTAAKVVNRALSSVLVVRPSVQGES